MSTTSSTVSAVRVLGAGLAATTVAVTTLAIASSFARAVSTEDFTASGVRQLQVDVDAGAVDVERAEGSTVEVSVRAEGTWRTPTTGRSQQGGTLVLDGRCGPQVGFSRCEVRYRIAVPDGVDLELRAGAGRLAVDDVSGDVSAHTSAGEVALTDLRSRVVDARAEAGRVQVSFEEPPRQVRAAAATGAIDVTLPLDGAPYAVQARADVGGATVDVPTDPTSARTVSAVTSVGAVTVRGR